MPESRLPIEICELVINNFDDNDEPALRACSLVCKTLLPVTRRLLFRHVNLTCRETAERFLDIICSPPSSTSPCRYVCKLSICEGRCGIESEWINKALPVLAERLLDVTTLEFNHLRWSLLDDVGQRAILSGFLKVRNLELVYSDFRTSEEMNRFIASFPSLVDLYCASSFWYIDGPLKVALPQGLQSIGLDSDHSLFFHGLLSRELHGSHGVRALKFYDIKGEEMENVGRLLKTLGSRLEELNFGHIYSALCDKECNAEAVFCKHIDLAHNTHLRFIRLCIFQYTISPLTWVVTLLSQITSPYLVEIFLEFKVKRSSDLKTIDWTPLVDVFNQQRWSNLQELRVLSHAFRSKDRYGLSEISAVDAFIKARFSVLESWYSSRCMLIPGKFLRSGRRSIKIQWRVTWPSSLMSTLRTPPPY